MNYQHFLERRSICLFGALVSFFLLDFVPLDFWIWEKKCIEFERSGKKERESESDKERFSCLRENGQRKLNVTKVNASSLYIFNNIFYDENAFDWLLNVAQCTPDARAEWRLAKRYIQSTLHFFLSHSPRRALLFQTIQLNSWILATVGLLTDKHWIEPINTLNLWNVFDHNNNNIRWQLYSGIPKETFSCCVCVCFFFGSRWITADVISMNRMFFILRLLFDIHFYLAWLLRISQWHFPNWNGSLICSILLT